MKTCGLCPKGYDEQRYLDGKGYLCDSNSCQCEQAFLSKNIYEKCPGGVWYIKKADGGGYTGFCYTAGQKTQYDPICQSGVTGRSCEEFCFIGNSVVDSYTAKNVFYTVDGQTFCEDSGRGGTRWTDRRCNVDVYYQAVGAPKPTHT